ncbi:hypothetical protein SacmaDRAFT_0298 [Saccharomonospora marina XMU15]|uniref:Uncharacterized protein n=1 Tax=Saccharomonospora marina XMU15 TaxID=882083 RepID=H5X183_9PSEU|nr:hypothetical protein [Saccharomonospora marina]EHR48607.1 hypothetical protein SacmaDRAFT_0298 [Saccharomonospora marina XMU15]
MACKITHRVNDQQIRFANRDAAERYAEIMGGGVDNWHFTIVPSGESQRGVVTESVRPQRVQS